MIESLTLAVGLSMDAFAVSIGLGASRANHRRRLAFWAAVYFGLSQGLMPLFGYLIGRSIMPIIGDYTGIVAFAILLIVGLKMLYEAFAESDDHEPANVAHSAFFWLAIATSIDALAAGFTLNLLSISPYLGCLIITLITAIFSYAGVYLGAKTGEKYESNAEAFGGIVLIAIGINFLLA